MTPPFDPTFGGRLRRLRETSGLSVPELARRAGLTRTQIHNYEGGRQEPRLSALIALADALGTAVDTLARQEPTDHD